MQTVIVNKFVVGLMAIFVMFNMNILFRDNLDAKIYKYDGNKFYGELIVKDNKLPLIIKVNENSENNISEKTYNENKDYNEQKEHNINNNINKKEEIINRNDENINKKEEKSNENIRITDDKTPGILDIIIKNGDTEVKINRNMGSKDMSEIDKEICRKSIDAVIDFIKSIEGKSNIKKGVIDKVKGFKDYISRSKEGRWFKW